MDPQIDKCIGGSIFSEDGDDEIESIWYYYFYWQMGEGSVIRSNRSLSKGIVQESG